LKQYFIYIAVSVLLVSETRAKHQSIVSYRQTYCIA